MFMKKELILAEIEVYKEIDVEQGIRQTFEDDLIKNKNNIQVYMSKSVTTDMKKMMEKIVKMILTKNKAQLDEIENKIQNLANIVESKKTRNIYQLSDLFGMGIRVDDKLNGDNSSELKKKIIATDTNPGLLKLYNQAIDLGDKEKKEEILIKFSLNQDNNIE
ncbi:hypothetical protein RCL_jg28977.t1 [Rhizophagus clarus]|uniref:Uncharacterized protein n=1 Tax=Rhizophagus clarus TaxID=94130 RepID=A0A8H3QV70_9GLOM|nr:hypothetical protein RCL_jg28977.t1 [Rhizophagus clarus]